MDNIREIRKRSKLSQQQFSKKYGIPLKTFQKWEQNVRDPLPYLISLINDDISHEEYIDVEKYILPKKNSFKKVIPHSFPNIRHIHPIQQKRVYEIIEEVKKYIEVQSITIFGSSTTYKCTYESDIDIYVELTKDINVKTFDVDCPIDCWTNFSASPNLIEEIKNKGVRVYDRRKLL